MSEYSEQLYISNYLSIHFPDVIFFTDGAAGIKLNIGQAVKLKNLKACRGLPDLFIMEANNKFHGLCIELKKTGEKLFKRDRITFRSDHLQEQATVLERLEAKGYYACFCLGYESAIHTIQDYMSNKL